jgi:hypothetical protein
MINKEPFYFWHKWTLLPHFSLVSSSAPVHNYQLPGNIAYMTTLGEAEYLIPSTTAICYGTANALRQWNENPSQCSYFFLPSLSFFIPTRFYCTQPIPFYFLFLNLTLFCSSECILCNFIPLFLILYSVSSEIGFRF